MLYVKVFYVSLMLCFYELSIVHVLLCMLWIVINFTIIKAINKFSIWLTFKIEKYYNNSLLKNFEIKIPFRKYTYCVYYQFSYSSISTVIKCILCIKIA